MRIVLAAFLVALVSLAAAPVASATASPLGCAQTFAGATQSNAEYPVGQGGRHVDAAKDAEARAAERFALAVQNGFGSWTSGTTGNVGAFLAGVAANPGAAATGFATREVALTQAYAGAVSAAAVPVATAPVAPVTNWIGNVGQAAQWEQAAAFAFVVCL